ncbi:hypothetical protein F3J09_20160 [Bacillus sp. Ab-1751]|uniref:hypothetical protein n=1 Tax=Bacillus sp. Ab-1751 TaxID=2608326 RepID=UPI001420BC69|nr:hypothetical protein [Bacillus sp. Ab-1751]
MNLVIGIKENWLSIDKDHSRDYKILIPLEWAPVKLHSKILSNVEALMIKSLNPELNIQLVKDGVENKRKVRSKYNYSVQLISNIKGINPSTPLTKTFEIKKIIEIDRSKMQFKASGQVEFYNILK